MNNETSSINPRYAGAGSSALSFMPSLFSERENYDAFVSGRSDTIRVARVLCILAMCYVHIHVNNLNATIGTFVVDVLGRSSVPLLSVISGLLMVGYFRKPFLKVVWLRFKALLIPMMTWGVVGWCVYYVLGDVFNFSINDVIPLWAKGKMIHLAFLRDMFVLMLATPAMIALLKRFPVALLLLIMIGFWAPIEPLMLRPQILPFYAFGLFLGLYQFSVPRLLNAVALGAFIGVAILVVFIGVNGYYVDNFFLRPFSAWAFWLFALMICRFSFMKVFIRFEPAIFLVFLCHPVVGRVLTGAYQKTHLPLETLFWLTTPFICLGIAMIGKHVLDKNKYLSAAFVGK